MDVLGRYTDSTRFEGFGLPISQSAMYFDETTLGKESALKITKDLVAAIDYSLTDDSGEVLDASDADEPLAYIHGGGSLIPGLERELEGREAGDSFNAVVEPADAYGIRDESLIFTTKKKRFDDPDELAVGVHFQAEISGEVKLCTILEIDEKTVKVDANHPLAGMTLHFDVTVRDVREPTEEELEHGHVHGAGGHHH